MKRLIKIIKYLFLIVFTLVITLVVIAKINEDRIASLAFKKVSEIINGPIEIDGASVTLLRRFPLASVEFSNVWLGNPKSTDSDSSAIDTVASIKKLYISVKSRPLFKERFEIAFVELKGVNCNYMVDSAGESNLDFLIKSIQKDTLPETPDSTNSSINLLLKKLSLEDIYLYYQDEKMKIHSALSIPKIEISAEVNDSIKNGKLDGSFILSNVHVNNTNLHYLKQANASFNIDYLNDSIDIKTLKIKTDELDVNLSGKAILGDTIFTNLKLLSSNFNLGKLEKYASSELRKLGINNVKGTFNANGTIKGLYSKNTLPKIDLDFSLKNGAVKTKDYPTVENLEFAGQITNGYLRTNKTTEIKIRSLKAETENSSLNANISLKNLDTPQYKIKTQLNLTTQEFNNYIPDSLLSDVSGNIQVDLTSEGVIPDSVTNKFTDYLLDNSALSLTLNNVRVDVDSNFYVDSLFGDVAYSNDLLTIQNIRGQVPKYHLIVDNLSVEAQKHGQVSNIKEMGINLSSINLLSNMLSFSGSTSLSNLSEPEYNLICRAELDFKEVSKVIPDSIATELSGILSTSLSSYGNFNLDSIAADINKIVFEQSKINLKLENIKLRSIDTLVSVDNFSASAELNSNLLKVDNLKGEYKGIDFRVDSLRARNFYESIINKKEEEILLVEVNVGLGDLDYSMWNLFKTPKDSAKASQENSNKLAQTEDTATANKYTPKYSIKGKFQVESVTYNKAYANNIHGKFNVSDSLYLLEDFRFDAFDGSMNTSIRYKIAGEDKTIWINNIVNKMDAVKLLADFDDFKEFYKPAISHTNISGLLSSEVHVQVHVKGDSLERGRMRSKGSLKLENGGIYNYPPVADLAKHMPPTFGDLDNLKFKTIDTKVFIFKDAVFVPETFIATNKFDASVIGMQGFGEDYSYHVEAFLSDILFSKNKRKNEKQDEIQGELKDTRKKGTLVKSFSIDGKTRTGIDTRENRILMQQKIQRAEGLLKLRFFPTNINYNTNVE